MADVDEVEVVVAHRERATLRVGDVFLKIDADQTRTDIEVTAMAMAPIPTPEVLWRKPPVLALAALPGTALGRLGELSIASIQKDDINAVAGSTVPVWIDRSGRPVPSPLQRSDVVDGIILAASLAEFAERYGDQTEKDHAALVEAIRSGRVAAVEGEE